MFLNKTVMLFIWNAVVVSRAFDLLEKEKWTSLHSPHEQEFVFGKNYKMLESDSAYHSEYWKTLHTHDRLRRDSDQYGRPPPPPPDQRGRPPPDHYGRPPSPPPEYDGRPPPPPRDHYGRPPPPPRDHYGRPPPPPPEHDGRPPPPPRDHYGRPPPPPRDHYGRPQPPPDHYGRPPPPFDDYGRHQPPHDHYGRPPPPYDDYGRHQPPHDHYGRPPPHDHYGRRPPYEDFGNPSQHNSYGHYDRPPPHDHYGRPPPPPPDDFNSHSSSNNYYKPHYNPQPQPRPPSDPKDNFSQSEHNDTSPLQDDNIYDKNKSQSPFEYFSPSNNRSTNERQTVQSSFNQANNNEEELIRVIEFLVKNNKHVTSTVTPSESTDSETYKNLTDEKYSASYIKFPFETENQLKDYTNGVQSAENPYIYDVRDGLGHKDIRSDHEVTEPSDQLSITNKPIIRNRLPHEAALGRRQYADEPSVPPEQEQGDMSFNIKPQNNHPSPESLAFHDNHPSLTSHPQPAYGEQPPASNTPIQFSNPYYEEKPNNEQRELQEPDVISLDRKSSYKDIFEEASRQSSNDRKSILREGTMVRNSPLVVINANDSNSNTRSQEKISSDTRSEAVNKNAKHIYFTPFLFQAEAVTPAA